MIRAARLVAVTVLPDGRVASGGWDRVVRVWDPDDPSGDSSVFDEHTDSVEALAALPDGRVLSGSADRTVRLWTPS